MQVIVLDRHEVVRAVLGDGPSACPILEDLHTETLENSAIEYQFAVPADHPDAQTIAPEGYVIIRDMDGLLQQLRIKTVEDELDSEGKRIRRVEAENAALELNGSIIRPTTWTGVTASQALGNALANTRWQPGIVDWLGSRTITIDGYKTVTEVLLQIASEFGGELRWRVEWKDGRIVARYVDLLQQRGRHTGKRFEYAKDIEGLTRTEYTTELVTAMIGLGASDENGNRLNFTGVAWSKANGDPADKPAGQDWIGDPDALQRWGLPGGVHIMGLYDDPEETDPERLLEKTWAALQARVNSRYSYEIDVALLERIADFKGHERVNLGDTITVHDYTVDPPLVLEARVIEIQRSYVDPSQDKVKLGYYRPLITSQAKVVADLQRRLAQKQGQWDAKESPIHKGPTPPDNPQDGMLWLNTSQTPNAFYRYDGTQWVKADPTEAADIGAETPEGAAAKAAAAENNAKTFAQLAAAQAESNAKAHADQQAATVESNAKSYADNVAAQAEDNAKNAVANGEVPLPTSALQGALDAAKNAIESKAAFVYWDGSGIIVYDRAKDQNPTKAVRIGAGGILVADSKDANGNWIWRTAMTGTGVVADEVNTGTLKGVNVELGGAGNGNGLLVVRDASGVERARLDNVGATVTDSYFLLRESRSGATQSIINATNLVNDHSFELIPRKGSADAYQTFEVDETYMGSSFWWQAIPGVGSTEKPRVLSTYDTDSIQYALFDFQAVVVRHHSKYAWRQYVPVDQAAALLGPYTGSAHFTAYGATTANTTAYMEMYAVDYTLSRIALLGTASVPINASEKFKWKRTYKTISSLPPGTNYVEIFIYSNPDVPILCDGVQFVAAPYPVVYNPESALWRHARGLAGYVNVEGIAGGQPPSIRITRTSAQAIQSGVSTPISWQGRYPGYNSAGMWDPNQPDLTQIFAPESGKYLIVCTLRWAANGTGYRLATIKVNGGDNISKVQDPPIAGSPFYHQVVGVAHLNAGDYIQIVVLQNSGATLNLETETQTAPVLTMIKVA